MINRIEKRLDELTRHTGVLHPMLAEAMRYSLLDAGKRTRPGLVIKFCEAAGGEAQKALDCACAVEMIHTYSLIHDDLPCMDDDDIRRGKPSCHCRFGEAEALLAGDALQMLAMQTILECSDISYETRAKACAELARQAGPNGMVGGQMIDICSVGTKKDIAALEMMHGGKTCALIEASCVIGCICAGRDDHIEAARKYAHGIGMAFQITDDVLDVVSDTETLGKPINSDKANEKYTYVSLLGIEGAMQEARKHTEYAVNALSELGAGADELKAIAWHLLSRKK